MIMKTVYKVVRRIDKIKFESAFNSNYNCQYRLEETTTNEKMPLFAFDTLENARNYENWNHTILKCNAVVSLMQPKRRAECCYDNPETRSPEFDLFWKQIRNHKKITVRTRYKVKGTIFCSSITPLNIVPLI